MAPVYQTSRLSSVSASKKYSSILLNSYSVTVEDFDGESMDFEIEAESCEDAARQAEAMAAGMGCYQILNMFIYSL